MKPFRFKYVKYNRRINLPSIINDFLKRGIQFDLIGV